MCLQATFLGCAYILNGEKWIDKWKNPSLGERRKNLHRIYRDIWISNGILFIMWFYNISCYHYVFDSIWNQPIRAQIRKPIYDENCTHNRGERRYLIYLMKIEYKVNEWRNECVVEIVHLNPLFWRIEMKWEKFDSQLRLNFDETFEQRGRKAVWSPFWINAYSMRDDRRRLIIASK